MFAPRVTTSMTPRRAIQRMASPQAPLLRNYQTIGPALCAVLERRYSWRCRDLRNAVNGPTMSLDKLK